MVTPRDTLKDLLHFSHHLLHLIVECHTNFSSSETRMCYQQVQSGCYLLLTWSSQNNIINIVDQCDILWKRHVIEIIFNKVMTQAGELTHSCGKTVKVCMLLLLEECHIWSSSCKQSHSLNFQLSTIVFHDPFVFNIGQIEK